ncbi:MAG: MFS transporter [Propionibacteriaceae bacterium]|nr:MFS transporter [Micropruina sp.]HBX81175.1 MFS transporter [Propionibacteriaceae bacterium]HBY24301.1 MFS transporter [Propionibacteriaceae bacterium]
MTTTETAGSVSRPSPLAPLRITAFRWLWLGVVMGTVGAFAQTVGAQWLFVDDPHADTIVPLVQTAMALPTVLLAFPAGVLADAFDRRWIMLGVQIYFFAVSTGLAVLTYLGQMTPPLLLGFTFALGVGTALQLPTWGPIIAELVPRDQLAAATRLDMINVNVARAIGPALAGFIIARWGVPPVFLFNALSVLFLIAALVLWNSREPAASNGRERFIPALRAGGRYVRHEPVVRRILIRLAAFVAPAAAMWALLPLIAARQLGMSAAGYGALFLGISVGAVTGALTVGQTLRHLSSNAMVAVAGLCFGAPFALVAFAPSLWVALPLLAIAGYGWTVTAAVLMGELQLFLPSWVRARAIAIYLMVFMACQALAAPIWGAMTTVFGLQWAVVIAGGLAASTAVLAKLVPIQENETLDRGVVEFWSTANLPFEPLPDAGPIAVSVEYDVPRNEEDNFLEAMEDMRRSRRRNGAVRWDLYRVGEKPHRFVELFVVPSWEEHIRQHSERLTPEDQRAEEVAFAYTVRTPKGRHLLPPRGLDLTEEQLQHGGPE